MRWTGLALGLVVALASTVALADTPEFVGQGGTPGALMRRGQLFGGQNWWTRYGEPVNAETLNQPGKGEVMPVGAIGMHGADYAYGPGACDCPPPCIDHLWDGYSQHPKRCDGYKPWFFKRHCGGCGGYGCGDCMSCTQAAVGCAEPVCDAPVGCADVVPDCGCAKPVCGCGRKHHLHHLKGHLKDKWHCWTAHWHRKGCCDTCDSCSAPLGCGCAAPIGCGCAVPLEGKPLDMGPPPPPVMAPKTAPLSVPVPAADDAAFLDLPRIN